MTLYAHFRLQLLRWRGHHFPTLHIVLLLDACVHIILQAEGGFCGWVEAREERVCVDADSVVRGASVFGDVVLVEGLVDHVAGVFFVRVLLGGEFGRLQLLVKLVGVRMVPVVVEATVGDIIGTTAERMRRLRLRIDCFEAGDQNLLRRCRLRVLLPTS